ncbi:hypothetical protein [Actinoplanes utahensis]|uniref:hypothetical protein n=1 Tax=Actinoplanes utahensis TaxID=1869 RepID=UPI0006920F1B|nr:hypothetical protein [Actinoplanes utahensis]
MTTPPQPDPAAEKPVGQFLRPLRDLATYALVGAVAVFLLVDIINGFRSDFIGGLPWSSGGIVGLETILFPIAAVLLALGVQPVHSKAKLITLIALVEYGVAALFGVIFDVFFGVSKIAAMDAGVAFTALLARAAWLALLAVPAYAVVQIWLGLFNVPKPKPAPGVYGQPYGQPPFGQPQYGAPQYGQTPPPAAPYQPGAVPPPAAQTYGQPVATQPFNPQASPYGQYPAVPAPPPPGWGQPPVSGAPGVPGAPFAEPTQAVPPTSAPPFSAPSVSAPPAYTPSTSAPPAYTPSTSAPPASAPPASVLPASAPPASAPPAQPAGTPPTDRTEVLPQDRPGFGPADQDPPRQ